MLQLQAPGRWKNIVRLSFSPDTSKLVGGCLNYGVVVWDVGSRDVRSQHRLRAGSVLGLLVAHDRGFICLPTGQGGLVHLTYPNLYLLSSDSLREAEYVRFAALSPDGNHILRSVFTTVGQSVPYGIAMMSNPPLWDVRVWQQFDPEWISMSATFLSGRQVIVTADLPFGRSEEGRLCVRHAGTGAIVNEVRSPSRELVELVASTDGRWLTLLAGRSLWVWDTIDWSVAPKKLMNDMRPHFTSAAFYPSGRYLAATSNDTTVKLYDTDSWQVAKTFTWNVGRLRSIAFSPDGTLAAVGSDSGKIVVWDIDL